MAPVATESTAHADGRVGRRIENYAGFWQKDLSKEAGQDTENRLANYTDVINGECFVLCRLPAPSCSSPAFARWSMFHSERGGA